jgi:hypothetical protein
MSRDRGWLQSQIDQAKQSISHAPESMRNRDGLTLPDMLRNTGHAQTNSPISAIKRGHSEDAGR